MAIVVEAKDASIPEIEDGLYDVTCTAVGERVMDTDQFGNIDKIELLFFISTLSTDEEPVFIQPLLNRKWGEKATLFKYAQAFGLNPNPFEAFDVERFVKARARVLIGHPNGDDGWPRVMQVMPLPKGTTQKAAAGNQKAQSRPIANDPPTSPAEEGAIAWWTKVRAAGHKRDEVIAASRAAYDREPVDLTEDERASLWEALG